MKILNVKMVVSPDRVKLVINDNLAYDGTSLDAESLLRYIQNEAVGPVNLQTHYEWTEDMNHWERDGAVNATLSPGDMEVISIGEPPEEDEEDECEHLHVEHNGTTDVATCLDCGATGVVDWS